MSFQVIIGSGLETSIVRQASPIMEKDLNIIRATMIEEMTEPKSGRVYRTRGGASHQASAPGEAPARRTGRLIDSIGEPRVGKAGRQLVGILFIAAPYAGFLEGGTGRMGPRPFVRPAVDALLKGLSRIGG